MTLVLIRLPKCLLALTEAELRSLLARDPTLWATALRRGKAVQRAAAASKRARWPRRHRDPASEGGDPA